jgi:hypothetical protein
MRNMCRYSEHHYKERFICLDCRLSFKDISTCPKCGKEMINIGRDFKVPAKTNLNQWKKVSLLVQNSIMFHSCGCGGPGYRPKTYQETKRWIKSEKKKCL